jgi:hypothetical protein
MLKLSDAVMPVVAVCNDNTMHHTGESEGINGGIHFKLGQKLFGCMWLLHDRMHSWLFQVIRILHIAAVKMVHKSRINETYSLIEFSRLIGLNCSMTQNRFAYKKLEERGDM